VFTATPGVVIPANTNPFCSLSFDVILDDPGLDTDMTPLKAEVVAGYSAFASDALCDNGLASSGSQSGSIDLPSPTPTPTPTDTPTDTPTNTPEDTPTNTPEDTPTNTNTPTNTVTNTPQDTPTNTPTNSATPSNTPTNTPEGEEICRTKGFWKTHSCPQTGCEKAGSSNITQAVIDAAGGSILVCGETLTNTDLNDAMSALEALCGQGGGITQLTSQLTAAALNCVITSGTADCSGVASIFATFTACNEACANGNTTAMVDGMTVNCIDAIDAFNSNPACEAQPLCNPEIDVCFNDPGPAGSAMACNDAAKNECTIFTGSPPCAP
jgi:hypothetical protein